MKTIEYRDTVDKSEWPRGVWDNEPDKIQWQDEATGLPCLIVRNHMGSLCGYVGVDKSHPFYHKHYSGEYSGEHRDYENSPSAAVSVHGGLTFSDFCDNSEECRAICHKVETGENDNVWWLGFDCGHAFDMIPGMDKYTRSFMKKHPEDFTYRDVAYVQAECTSLAKQLKDIQNGNTGT